MLSQKETCASWFSPPPPGAASRDRGNVSVKIFVDTIPLDHWRLCLVPTPFGRSSEQLFFRMLDMTFALNFGTFRPLRSVFLSVQSHQIKNLFSAKMFIQVTKNKSWRFIQDNTVCFPTFPNVASLSFRTRNRQLFPCCVSSPTHFRTSCPREFRRTQSVHLPLDPKYLQKFRPSENICSTCKWKQFKMLAGILLSYVPLNFLSRIIWDNFFSTVSWNEENELVNVAPQSNKWQGIAETFVWTTKQNASTLRQREGRAPGSGWGGGGFRVLNDNDACVTPQGRPDFVALGLKTYQG